jgi:hypothetical protein
VFLGLGIFRLTKVMRNAPEQEDWRLSYLRNPFARYLVIGAFVGFNIVILVVTAIPVGDRSVPAFYSPVMMGAILLVSLAYLGFLKLLSVRVGRGNTVGQRVGFEVQVYTEGDEDIPERMKMLMTEANWDGSRRRLAYTVSPFPH